MRYLIFIWKNIWFHPLKTIFNILLIAIAVSLILILILTNRQFSQHLGKTSENIDMILCAKGSPLQSVLCNIFHIDAPTGNINVQDIQPFLKKSHPLIQHSCPLSLGDSYHSSRIVGTTLDYFDWMQLKLSGGRIFNSDMEVVIGSHVASSEKIKLNDTLFSNHGLIESELQHEHRNGLIVVGILKETNNIQDKLIFTTISTYWKEHEGQENNDEMDHPSTFEENNKIVLKNEDLLNNNKEVSSVLIQFKGKNIQTLNFARNINENTKLMAVSPAIEISRLYSLSNSAEELMFYMAMIIGLMSLIAIFLNLIQALDERKHELTNLRIGGALPRLLFGLLMLEGLILSLLGAICGFIMGHVLLHWASIQFNLQSRYGISGMYFTSNEMYVLMAAIFGGMLAAIIPALRAYRR